VPCTLGNHGLRLLVIYDAELLRVERSTTTHTHTLPTRPPGSCLLVCHCAATNIACVLLLLLLLLLPHSLYRLLGVMCGGTGSWASWPYPVQ
jgi:hypothetical protein